MGVYDDPNHGQLKPTDDNAPNGSSSDEQTAGGSASGGTGSELLNRERSAAAGKDPSVQSSDHDGNNVGGNSGGKDKDTRGDLKDKEGGSFFKGKDSGNKQPMPKRLKRNIAIASFISGIVGVGSGAGIAGYISGPLQFLQAGNLLSQFQLQDKEDQTEVRLMTSVRYIRNFARGTPERSRLGYLGNKVADRAEARFNTSGVKSNYGSLGVGRGYTINPKELKGGVFDKIDPNKRTPEGVRDFMKSEFGINATIDGNRVVVDTTKADFNYRANKRFTFQLQKAAGARGVTSAVNSRFAGKRAGVLWHKVHKIGAIDRKIDVKIEDRFNKWLEAEDQDLKKGSGSIKPGSVDTEKDDKGKSIGSADADSSAIQETIGDAAAAHGNADGMKAFRAKMSAKLSKPLGLAGLIDVLCLMMYMSQHIDQLNRDNVENPLMRFFVGVISTPSQIQSGVDLDGNTEQLGFRSRMFYDEKNKNSFFDSKPIKSAQGLPGGQEVPDEFKVGDDDNILARLFNNISGITGYLQTACKVTSSLLGTIVLTGLTVAAGGGVLATAISAIIGAVAIPILVDYITNKLAGDEVSTEKLVGAAGGGGAMYGGHFFGNNEAMAYGGLPIDPAEDLALKQSTQDDIREEFQSKNLAYRLFSPDDPKSFMAQVIQKQRPDPEANIAMYASSILNVGKTFGSLFAKPLLSMTVGAADVLPYDYGTPSVAYTLAEMQDRDFEDSPANELAATKLLDNDTSDPTLVKRAVVCFGVTLEQTAVDPENPTHLAWSVRAPQEGEQPLIKNVLKGQSNDVNDNTDYKCMNKQEKDWKTIRFFIMDSEAMNAYACYDGDPDADYTKQACVDSGQNTQGGEDATIMDLYSDPSADVATTDTTTSLQRRLATLKLPTLPPVSSMTLRSTLGTYSELFNHAVSRAGSGYVF